MCRRSKAITTPLWQLVFPLLQRRRKCLRESQMCDKSPVFEDFASFGERGVSNDAIKRKFDALNCVVLASSFAAKARAAVIFHDSITLPKNKTYVADVLSSACR
jgi:hypothetical protein